MYRPAQVERLAMVIAAASHSMRARHCASIRISSAAPTSRAIVPTPGGCRMRSRPATRVWTTTGSSANGSNRRSIGSCAAAVSRRPGRTLPISSFISTPVWISGSTPTRSTRSMAAAKSRNAGRGSTTPEHCCWISSTPARTRSPGVGGPREVSTASSTTSSGWKRPSTKPSRGSSSGFHGASSLNLPFQIAALTVVSCTSVHAASARRSPMTDPSDLLLLGGSVVAGLVIAWLIRRLRAAEDAQHQGRRHGDMPARNGSMPFSTRRPTASSSSTPRGIIEAFNRGAERLFGYPDPK